MRIICHAQSVLKKIQIYLHHYLPATLLCKLIIPYKTSLNNAYDAMDIKMLILSIIHLNKSLIILVTSNSSPHSPFHNGYSMMSPYLPPNTSSYLESSSDGVCGSIVGLNGGGIGPPPGTNHSNPPPPPHMVSNT